MGLQIRRGLSSQMTNSVTPESGEPIYTLDDSKLYIGDGTTTADNLTPINQTFATTGLSDVSSISATNETFLLYNSSTSEYEPTAFALATLPEVYSAPTTANQVLAYDGNPSNPSYGKLAPTLVTLGFLSDVNITSIQNGDTIVWDSASSSFINQAGGGGGGSSTFIGLTDTPSVMGTAGQRLAVNSGATALEFVDNTVDSLSDTSLFSLNQGDILMYDSFTNQWINSPQQILETIVSGGFLVNAANDTAAASAGVPINNVYRNGSVLQVRVT